MNALKSRKQLLIAESDLNRAQMLHELQSIGGAAHALVNRAKTAGSVASAVASLVAGLSSFHRQESAPAAGKSSRWQFVGQIFGMASTLWSAFRSLPNSNRE